MLARNRSADGGGSLISDQGSEIRKSAIRRSGMILISDR
jgi:hypothetical protein